MTDQISRLVTPSPAALLEGAFDALPVGVALLGADGEILFANPAFARLLEYQPAELVGARLSSLREPPATIQMTRVPVADHTAGMTEIALVESGGSGPAEEVERARLEARLRQAQKMDAVAQLTGGIAHDFNNMLTVVLANAELIAGALAGNPAALGDLGELRAAARRGSEMVRKLLSFSRRERLMFQPVRLGKLVEDMAAHLREILPPPIELEITTERTPETRADSHAIEQILLNVLTNARDAMPDGGRVRIHAGVETIDADRVRAQGWGDPGEYVCLTVTDTGTGMDEATRARLFEPFFTTKPPGLGTGLGMAMIYGLAKQHGGFVHVDSAPQRGTTVRICFPVGDSPALPEQQGAPRASPPRGTELILVVDDEEPVRRAARRVLERFGYRVLTAGDGTEALGIIRERGNEIDLVISDVAMPRLGGRGLYDAARASGAKMKFLFASGYTARDIGATGDIDPSLPFIHKPWTLDDFLRRIREVLTKGR
ncbi:MAG: response regulator [Gemmatimonadetes bacterium]|nr:response regulator [Gemmatimonadota bacterium]